MDPRGVSDEELTRLCAETPRRSPGSAIRSTGDETSGSDAALALTWHLLAATDAQVSDLLERVVIVLDPSLNPDGRARILSMVEQFGGKRVNLDYETMACGRWPEGRGNHYLFDMNRD
ncbi:MAG: M14 family zinc carboxypeptidase [Planctomycetota bacterium]